MQASTEDSTSLLTFGDDILVCGNPTQALRAKRNVRSHDPPCDAVPIITYDECPRVLEHPCLGAEAVGPGFGDQDVPFLDALCKFKLESAIAGAAPASETSEASSDEAEPMSMSIKDT